MEYLKNHCPNHLLQQHDHCWERYSYCQCPRWLGAVDIFKWKTTFVPRWTIQQHNHNGTNHHHQQQHHQHHQQKYVVSLGPLTLTPFWQVMRLWVSHLYGHQKGNPCHGVRPRRMASGMKVWCLGSWWCWLFLLGNTTYIYNYTCYTYMICTCCLQKFIEIWGSGFQKVLQQKSEFVLGWMQDFLGKGSLTTRCSLGPCYWSL